MSSQQQEAVDEQSAERPRDRFRRYLAMEIGSYDLALSVAPTLDLTAWKRKVANEILDLFDDLELREVLAKAKANKGRR